MPATDSDRQLGEQFHDRLFALLPQARHDDDPDHFAAVGAAMRLGLQEGQIEQAGARLQRLGRRSMGMPPCMLSAAIPRVM